MSYLSRLGRALLDVKASAVGPLIARVMLGQPVWPKRDYEKLAQEGYQQNAVVARAVQLVAENAANVPWLLYSGRGKGRKAIPEHPLLDLLDRPSPSSDGYDLKVAIYSHLMIAGNAYVERTDEGRLDRMELYAHRPDRVRVIPGEDGTPQGYEYRVHGAIRRWDIDADRGRRPLLHVKSFHPTDDWYGMSPLDPAAWSIDLHNGASAWNKALLDNTGAPSGAFVVEGKEGGADRLSDEQYARLKRQMAEEMQGSRNAGKPLLLEGGLKWQSMGLNPEQMQFVDARHAAAREIAFTLGVPPMLLGIPGDNTYSNYAEANRAFHRQTVIPLARRMASQFTRWFEPVLERGVYLEPDIAAIDALAVERAEQWQRISQAQFLSINEKREAVDYEAVEGGNDVYIGAGQIPIGTPDDGAIVGGAAEDDTAGDAGGKSPPPPPARSGKRVLN